MRARALLVLTVIILAIWVALSIALFISVKEVRCDGKRVTYAGTFIRTPLLLRVFLAGEGTIMNDVLGCRGLAF